MQCFPFALGKEECISTIYHNEFSPSSSLLMMTDKHRKAFPFTINNIEEKIQICILDRIISELVVQTPALMKIDVQGYELNVLLGAEKSLNLIDILIIETSFVKLYENQPLFDDIYCYLKERNFLYKGNFEQIEHPCSGEILQADAIFVKCD